LTIRVSSSLSSALYRRAAAGFDFGRDFVPVSAFAREPLALIANPANLDGIDSLGQLIEVARRRPRSIRMQRLGTAFLPLGTLLKQPPNPGR
jgi:hypothetical protein